MRHTYGARHHWDLPGGSIKGQEQPIETPRREIREELGVTVSRSTPMGAWTFRVEGCRDTIRGFRGRVGEVTRKVDRAEIAQARWFARGKLPVGIGLVAERLLAVSGDFAEGEK